MEIKNKRKSLYKLYNLVETLNTNNEDLDKCCGVATDFISKRDKIQISDEVTMIARNKRNDNYDQVIKNVDKGRSEEESEEKDQTKITKKDALQSDILEPGGKCEI